MPNSNPPNSNQSNSNQSQSDAQHMALAILNSLAGQGAVEPNPMVGCVVVADGNIIGQGWHEKFGGPHAEINALNSVKAEDKHRIAGATVFVSLEPCSHQGKTGPCCEALIQAKVGRVVVAMTDPNPMVAGQGIERLRTAGIQVDVGEQATLAAEALAPYLKRVRTGFPWVVAKWAMTIDGKIATACGSSQWISNPKSRQCVHDLRRRCDVVMVGIGTAIADDPMLNARPAGERKTIRAIVDSQARIPLESKIVQTAADHPTLIAVGPQTCNKKIESLEQAGCEIWRGTSDDANNRLQELLQHLAGRGCTNVMVEGGGKLLGALNDLEQIDEAHVFIGAKLLGGADAVSPVAGAGNNLMADATGFNLKSVQQIDNDILAIYRKTISPTG
jgi:diaminohydroxyphosphoribosylaminopyrimidine deaminase/5-amino-6-(5-phosphoribosylamino)uracil reductase